MDHSKYEFGVCYYSPNPDNMVKEFEEAGAELYYVNKFGGVSLLRFLLTLRGFIREFQPDIIHTWLISANFWGRLSGLLCGYKRFISSDRSLTRYSRLSRMVERLFVSRTIRTANTRALADWASRTLRVPMSRIRVIYNAVEIHDSLDPVAARERICDELGIPRDVSIILTVGRQTEAKNYPMLFRTARRILSERNDVVFLCAGHGEQAESLRRRHEDLGLGQGVRMLGLRRDVPSLIAAADVFCLCSRWEGFPNVLAEAMAGALPVICTRFAGVSEVLVDGEYGLTVDIDDDQAMATGILELLSASEQGKRMGQAGRARVKELFSWDALLQNMDGLYSEFKGPQAPCNSQKVVTRYS